ncbi:MAG: ATP-dependent Clp protease proteolytic subunit [Nitratireductor sp.]
MINMFISSPGGHVESGDMVHDMIKFIKPVVRTIGSGWVAGALIFVGAKRIASVCPIPASCCINQAAVLVVRLRISKSRPGRCKMRERFDRLFAAATGQTPERISRDTQRDFWLNTDEAIAWPCSAT